MLGLYAHHMGRLHLERKEDDEADDHLIRSFSTYYSAAKHFPPDDEKHACTSPKH